MSLIQPTKRSIPKQPYPNTWFWVPIFYLKHTFCLRKFFFNSKAIHIIYQSIRNVLLIKKKVRIMVWKSFSRSGALWFSTSFLRTTLIEHNCCGQRPIYSQFWEIQICKIYIPTKWFPTFHRLLKTQYEAIKNLVLRNDF